MLRRVHLLQAMRGALRLLTHFAARLQAPRATWAELGDHCPGGWDACAPESVSAGILHPGVPRGPPLTRSRTRTPPPRARRRTRRPWENRPMRPSAPLWPLSVKIAEVPGLGVGRSGEKWLNAWCV